MAIELKDVADFIGIEITEETTVDQVKESFNKKYVPTDKHSKALGEVNGIISSATKKAFKDIGIEYDSEELKGMETKDLPSFFATKAKAKFDQYETDKGSTAEQIEEKYKSDIEKYKGQITERDTLLNDVKTQFDTFKTEVGTKERTGKIQGEFAKSIGALKFSESVHELAQEGFKAKLSSTYSFDLNEEGKHVVKDSDGNLITSKVKAGEPATYDEVITTAFKESGLEQVVNPKKTTTFTPTPVPAAAPNGKQRVLAKRDD